MSRDNNVFVRYYDLLKSGDHRAIDTISISFMHEFKSTAETNQAEGELNVL